jgi:hypothetical protein
MIFEGSQRTRKLSDSAIRVMARPSAANHVDPAQHPLEVVGLCLGHRDSLHRISDRCQAVHAWSALTGGLGREVADDSSRLHHAASAVGENGHHAAAE